MRIVCMSDSHNKHRGIQVPDGDVLVHAGDSTMMGRPKEIASFNEWLGELPHAHKIIVAGNHDWGFFTTPKASKKLLTNATYLQDSGVTIDGVKFWGSPWQPEFMNWAFNLPRGRALKEKWDLIPAGTDVLVTHGPPAGRGDQTDHGMAAGCQDLLEAIRRVKPRLHVFGHVHEGAGITQEGPTKCVNASICDSSYFAGNPPIVVDLL